MQKLFASKSTKVGTIGVLAATAADLAQQALNGETIPPELIAMLANADLKYWVLAAVVLILAKISPDKEDTHKGKVTQHLHEEEKIGGTD
jgi:hypothetical protein